MMFLLYWAFIPAYCSDQLACRMNSEISYNAYNIFIGILILLMIGANALTALGCTSNTRGMNIMYAVFSTIACWSIFAFVVYSREYLRMSFSNVFGYFVVYSKINDILHKIVPKNITNTDILVNLLSNNEKAKYTKEDELTVSYLFNKALTKLHVDDNFELMTYLRSGTNYVKSLQYVKNYTNAIFRTDIGNAIDGGENTIKANTDLVDLLNVLYTRDIVGEIILFVMSGIMCAYLSEYLITKINCNYKSTQEIETSVEKYNEEYNKAQTAKNKQVVVTKTA